MSSANSACNKSMEMVKNVKRKKNKKQKRGSSNDTLSGRWSKEEQALFVKGLAIYGREWKRMSKMIPTRTIVQIRTHAQKYFIKQARLKAGNNGDESITHFSDDDDEDEEEDGSNPSIYNNNKTKKKGKTNNKVFSKTREPLNDENKGDHCNKSKSYHQDRDAQHRRSKRASQLSLATIPLHKSSPLPVEPLQRITYDRNSSIYDEINVPIENRINDDDEILPIIHHFNAVSNPTNHLEKTNNIQSTSSNIAKNSNNDSNNDDDARHLMNPNVLTPGSCTNLSLDDNQALSLSSSLHHGVSSIDLCEISPRKRARGQDMPLCASSDDDHDDTHAHIEDKDGNHHQHPIKIEYKIFTINDAAFDSLSKSTLSMPQTCPASPSDELTGAIIDDTCFHSILEEWASSTATTAQYESHIEPIPLQYPICN